ncbi:hypothetical protein BJ742DRAFT_826836 [Cladochytrium replicatum]|nr:hypothetical protein BJ742DRAFT_826836 [Cladochytrium replicatum]
MPPDGNMSENGSAPHSHFEGQERNSTVLITLPVLIRYQRHIANYERELDELARLPRHERLDADLQEVESYSHALSTTIEAKRLVLNALEKQLPPDSPSSPTLSVSPRMFGKMKRDMIGEGSDMEKFRLAYSQEQKALELMQDLQNEAEATIRTLRDQTEERIKHSERCKEILMEMFEGRTSEFPDEDQLERTVTKLAAKYDRENGVLEKYAVALGHARECHQSLRHLAAVVKKLKEKTSTDVITDHVFQSSKGWEFVQNTVKEYEIAVDTCSMHFQGVLESLDPDEYATKYLNDVDMSGWKRYLRVNRNQILSSDDINKVVERLKKPATLIKKAHAVMEQTYKRREQRLKTFFGTRDKAERELVKLRTEIMHSAVAMMRIQHGVNPTHPALLPSSSEGSIVNRRRGRSLDLPHEQRPPVPLFMQAQRAQRPIAEEPSTVGFSVTASSSNFSAITSPLLEPERTRVGSDISKDSSPSQWTISTGAVPSPKSPPRANGNVSVYANSKVQRRSMHLSPSPNVQARTAIAASAESHWTISTDAASMEPESFFDEGEWIVRGPEDTQFNAVTTQSVYNHNALVPHTNGLAAYNQYANMAESAAQAQLPETSFYATHYFQQPGSEPSENDTYSPMSPSILDDDGQWIELVAAPAPVNQISPIPRGVAPAPLAFEFQRQEGQQPRRDNFEVSPPQMHMPVPVSAAVQARARAFGTFGGGKSLSRSRSFG